MSEKKLQSSFIIHEISTPFLDRYTQKEETPADKETLEVQDKITFQSLDGFKVRREDIDDVMNGMYRDGNVADNGTIAIIPVKGVMRRSDTRSWWSGMRYSIGTDSLAEIIKQLDKEANIGAIVLDIDTPGGSAYGSRQVAEAIRNCNTPIIGAFDMMASAGVRCFQGCDLLYAKESGSEWGSIGTFATAVDDKRYWEQLGIDVIEVYAPTSYLKNKSTRDLFQGNEETLKQELEKRVEEFVREVKAMRPSIVDDDKVYHGQIYTAKEARKIKAIDGIMSMEDIIKKIASKEARRYARGTTSTNNNQQQMSEENKQIQDKVKALEEKVERLDKVSGNFLGYVKEDFANEQIDKANELVEKATVRAEQLQEKLEAQESELSKANAALTAANEQIASMKAKEQEEAKEEEEVKDELQEYKDTLSQVTEKVTELTGELKDLQEKAQALEAKNVAQATEITTLQTSNTKLQTDLQEVLEFNKKLGGDAIEKIATPTPAAQEDTTKGAPSGGDKQEQTISSVLGAVDKATLKKEGD